MVEERRNRQNQNANQEHKSNSSDGASNSYSKCEPLINHAEPFLIHVSNQATRFVRVGSNQILPASGKARQAQKQLNTIVMGIDHSSMIDPAFPNGRFFRGIKIRS